MGLDGPGSARRAEAMMARIWARCLSCGETCSWDGEAWTCLYCGDRWFPEKSGARPQRYPDSYGAIGS